MIRFYYTLLRVFIVYTSLDIHRKKMILLGYERITFKTECKRKDTYCIQHFQTSTELFPRYHKLSAIVIS